MVEKAESLDVPVLVGHHRRYNPIIKELTKLLSIRRIGKLELFMLIVGFINLMNILMRHGES